MKRAEKNKKLLSTVLTAIIVLSVCAVISATAATVSVTRDLPDTPVSPEEEITVSLTQSGFLFNAGIVTETLPEGFTYVPDSLTGNADATFDATTNNLTINFESETTVTYIVEAGTAEQIENAVFSGTYKTLDEGFNPITGDVEGDTTLTLAEPTPTPTPMPVTLIICFKEEIPGWVLEKYDVLDINEALNCILVKAPEKEKVLAESLAEVKYIEKNKLVHALYTPNDSYYPSQWGLKRINADKAWDIEKGSKNVTLAILDTGIDYGHEDIGNYAGGFDFVNNDSDPMDDHGHGTAVAGVAAAIIDNERGIAGIAQVNILVLKVLNETGWGTDWDVARAITYAANHSADVISMSFGGDSSAVMEDACDYAWNNNSLLVAASGNENSSVIFPAAYHSVIAVGATDEDDERASYSNFGPELELVVPGNRILTTHPDNSYIHCSGTSIATPHVAGVAALLKSKRAKLSNEEIRETLRTTAEDLGEEGKDDYYGYGLVDAYAALGIKFDTGPGTYPSIFGTHEGTITPSRDIYVTKIYTYPCKGTGGHTEFVWIYGNGINESASWNGYAGDWHNITFDVPFVLKANLTYNYTIRTGSYPQIHHTDRLEIDNGVITCISFKDVNGKIHYDWIPAIKLVNII
ncbi:MAG: S8 family serine peptidase [Halobacteriota archaeon]